LIYSERIKCEKGDNRRRKYKPSLAMYDSLIFSPKRSVMNSEDEEIEYKIKLESASHISVDA